MLSNLILRKQYVYIMTWSIFIWMSSFVIISGFHSMMFYGNAGESFSLLLSIIITILIWTASYRIANDKEKLFGKIHDLNNKLGPLYSLVNIVSLEDKFNDKDGYKKLINDNIEQCKIVLPKIKEIIHEIHSNIETL